MIILIISIILLLIGIFLIFQAKKIKTQRINQINQVQLQIINKNQQINTKQCFISILQENIKNYQQEINNQKNIINDLITQKTKITQEIDNQQRELNQQYDKKKEKYYENFVVYCNNLTNDYKTKEAQFNQKINLLNRQREQVEDQLTQIKKVYEAATAARLREQEDEQKWSFYRIRLTDQQSTDISRLQEWKQNLYDPTIVSKIIWSTYILKPTSDLCNRVLGSKTVCGIYKITNKATGEVYIGQSVNVAQRWKTHIKCGLGIDASSTNKLYNIMQNTGVWNFTFELLEECPRDKLNEKERFWIEMYQSNKVGMNLTKGNK